MVGEVSRGEQVYEGKEQVYQGCIWLHLTEASLHWLTQIRDCHSHLWVWCICARTLSDLFPTPSVCLAIHVFCSQVCKTFCHRHCIFLGVGVGQGWWVKREECRAKDKNPKEQVTWGFVFERIIQEARLTLFHSPNGVTSDPWFAKRVKIKPLTRFFDNPKFELC